MALPDYPRHRVLFVCSSGGHLAQLYRLERWWRHHERAWVTFDKTDARSLLEGERTWWAHHPTTRNVVNLARNFVLALRVMGDYQPEVVVSNGAGVALPFFLVARFRRRTRTVYLEVYDRIDSPTLTGLLCKPLTDIFCVQWVEQRRFYRRSVVIGPTL